jgi:ubiquinone/menaquinone biosynthesis C-methylase UbiE
MHERIFRAEQAHRLEDPARLEWLPPHDIMQAIDVEPGQTIADVGAGTGYFTVPLARQIGLHGVVYAVDVQPEMLGWIRSKIERDEVFNIQLVHADAHATQLPDECCDLFFLANLWHELDDRQATLREAMRVLKAEGRIAILDWRPDVERDFGPPLDHRLPVESCVKELQQAGFAVIVIKDICRYHWLVQGAR